MVNKSNRIKTTGTGEKILIYGVLGLFGAIIVLPFLVLVCTSLSSNESILNRGARFWIQSLNFDAYYILFQRIDDLLSSYLQSIIVTVFGTVINVVMVAGVGYSLSRNSFKGRKILTFFFTFTILFQAGYIPNYIWFSKLGITNSYFVLILAPAFMVAHMVFLRAFYSGLPSALYEAVKLDGASEFVIFFKIATPLIIPGIATVCFYSVLSYWNDSFTALLYTRNFKPLAIYLKDISYYVEWMKDAVENGWDLNIGGREMPTETILYAIAVVSSAPLLIVFSCLQKFFISGLTDGAVKG